MSGKDLCGCQGGICLGVWEGYKKGVPGEPGEYSLLEGCPDCLGMWNLACALLQRYRTMMCTIDLWCAPPTRVSGFGGSHGSCRKRTLFLSIWWVTMNLVDSKNGNPAIGIGEIVR